MNQSAVPPGRQAPTESASPTLETQRVRPSDQRGARLWKTPFVLVGVVFLVTIAFIVTPPDVVAPISGLSQLLSMLFCLGCTLWMLRRTERGRARLAWGVIAIAQFLFVIGDVIIIIEASTNASATSVSLADAFFLPLSPLTALGAILFPAEKSTFAKQVRIILDTLIGVGALFGLAVVFIIAPRVVSGTSNDYVFIIYPVADLTLLLTLVVLLVRGVQTSYRHVFFWLAVGMIFLVYADSSYNYLSLPGFHSGPAYSPGLPTVDPFFVAAAFAFSLAPLSQLREMKQGVSDPWRWLQHLSGPTTLLRRSGLLNQFLLLVLPVAVLVSLLIYLNTHPEQAGTSLALLLLTSLVVVLIISRQILTQSDLVDARIATDRAQQLDALKDQFITSVNHELRTPLMTMTGYVDLLADPEMEVSPERREAMLGRARVAGASLVQLVKSVLDTRRIEDEAPDFEPKAVSVREAAQTVLNLIDPHEANPTGRALLLSVQEGLMIWGEPVRLQQILTNLLSNAIKYSLPGAPITLSAHQVVDKGTGFLGLRYSRGEAQPMVEISVRDQGLGVPPDQQELLFRRFVRLPREIASNIHGTGLGLYLCRVYTEAMGGRIWVESTGVPGEGSSFYLRLPVPPKG